MVTGYQWVGKERKHEAFWMGEQGRVRLCLVDVGIGCERTVVARGSGTRLVEGSVSRGKNGAGRTRAALAIVWPVAHGA